LTDIGPAILSFNQKNAPAGISLRIHMERRKKKKKKTKKKTPPAGQIKKKKKKRQIPAHKLIRYILPIKKNLYK